MYVIQYWLIKSPLFSHTWVISALDSFEKGKEE